MNPLRRPFFAGRQARRWPLRRLHLEPLEDRFLPAASLTLSALRDLSGFSLQTLGRSDDGPSPLVDMGFAINLLGQTQSKLYVNTNGSLTFTQADETYTP